VVPGCNGGSLAWAGSAWWPPRRRAPAEARGWSNSQVRTVQQSGRTCGVLIVRRSKQRLDPVLMCFPPVADRLAVYRRPFPRGAVSNRMAASSPGGTKVDAVFIAKLIHDYSNHHIFDTCHVPAHISGSDTLHASARSTPLNFYFQFQCSSFGK
jgi:hypothetical protein